MKVLITGTSSGIGAGLAHYYLANDCEVYGISRKTNTSLAKNSNFKFLDQDLSKFEELEKNIPAFLSDLQSIDLVVLNAGVLSEIKDMKNTTLEEINQVMNINVWANKVLIDVLFKHVNEIKQLVAISSGAAVNGSRGWNAYSLSKASLNMLINLYSKELTNTHLSALAPGLVDTNMQEYLCNFPDDETFPTIKKLKNARGTEHMPNPEQAAQMLAEAMEKLKSYESGSFVDIRKM
jgi:benzil reductase ((S)-benzoin forming)